MLWWTLDFLNSLGFRRKVQKKWVYYVFILMKQISKWVGLKNKNHLLSYILIEYGILILVDCEVLAGDLHETVVCIILPVVFLYHTYICRINCHRSHTKVTSCTWEVGAGGWLGALLLLYVDLFKGLFKCHLSMETS